MGSGDTTWFTMSWKNSNQQIQEWLREEEICDPDITEIEDFSHENIDGVSAEAIRNLDQLQPMNAKPKYDPEVIIPFPSRKINLQKYFSFLVKQGPGIVSR